MSGITVRSSSGKLQKTTKDLREQSFVTGQPVGSNRRALDVTPIGYAFHMEDAILEAGTDDNLIKLTGHGCKEGFFLQIITATNQIKESEIVIDEIVDPDSFRLGAVLSAALQAGDTVSILKPVMPKYTEAGEALVEAVNYNYNYLRNGVKTQVAIDTVTPANNRPLPVQLMGINGTLSLTADNLDISSDHTEDSVAVGDGVNLIQIKAGTRELKTSDADVLAKLIEILAAQATASKQDSLLNAVGLLAKLTDTQPISAASLPLPSGAATQATLASLLTAVGLLAKLTDTQPVSAASLPLPSGASTAANQATGNTSLATIAGKDFSTAAKQDLLKAVMDLINTATGAPADAAVTAPGSSASVIAALKGLLTLIASTNTKLDSLETALTPELASHQTQVVNTVKTYSMPTGARRMIIQNAMDSDSPIRFVAAGSTPTAIDGFYLGVGQSTSEMAAGSFKAISVDGGNANVTVLWSV